VLPLLPTLVGATVPPPAPPPQATSNIVSGSKETELRNTRGLRSSSVAAC
jgi:hypothetical protein